MLNSRRATITTLIFLCICCIVGYSVYEMRGVLRYSPLEITEPKDWSVASSSLLLVRGKAVDVSLLTLNGRTIFTDEKGMFAEELLLPEGYTILELVAVDRLKRETRKFIHMYRY